MGDITKEILGQSVEETQVENQVNQIETENTQQWETVKSDLPAKTGFWNKFKAFWLQEIKVELTPTQQKLKDNINAFLNKEITFKSVKNFLFKEIKF